MTLIRVFEVNFIEFQCINIHIFNNFIKRKEKQYNNDISFYYGLYEFVYFNQIKSVVVIHKLKIFKLT